MPRFRIAKSQHQYGMRWAVLESPPDSILTREACRCPSMSDATLICTALNFLHKDAKEWAKTLGKAANSYNKYEARRTAKTASTSTSPIKNHRPGAGSARQLRAATALQDS